MSSPLIGMTVDYSPNSDVRPFSKGTDLYFQNTAYIRYLEQAECDQVLLPTLENLEKISSLVSKLDGLLLTGGDDVFSESYGEKAIDGKWRIDVQRTHYEIALIKEALKQKKPIYGICRGAQMINVALGGTLYQDIPQQVPHFIQHQSLHKPVWHKHPIHIKQDSILYRILGKEEITVNSSHHQAIKDLASGLRDIARASDDVIEAVQLDGSPFVLGVQWHPEEMQDDSSSQLILEAFLDACRRSS